MRSPRGPSRWYGRCWRCSLASWCWRERPRNHESWNASDQLAGQAQVHSNAPAAVPGLRRDTRLRPEVPEMALPDAGMPGVADAGATVAPVRVVAELDGEEVYRPPGFPDYAISRTGSLWSSRYKGVKVRQVLRWRKLKPTLNQDGYLKSAIMHESGKRKTVLIHSLVLRTFVGDKPLGMQACHGDNDKCNNCVDNLRWGTGFDNAADRRKHGTYTKGSQHHSSRLDEKDVRDIWRLLQEGEQTYKVIAAKFGVNASNIGHIIKGRSWKHLTRKLKPLASASSTSRPAPSAT